MGDKSREEVQRTEGQVHRTGIEELIEQGRARLAAEEAAKLAEQEEKQAAYARACEREREVFYAAAVGVAPGMLTEFVALAEGFGASATLNEATIRAPGCLPVVFRLRRPLGPAGVPFRWQWDGKWHVQVPWAICGSEGDREDGLFVRYDGRETGELEIALAWAADGQVRLAELEEEIARRMGVYRAEQVRLAEMQERWLREEQEKAAAAEAEDQEGRARMLDVMERDAVALALLQAFALVQEGRLRLAEDLLEGE